MEAGGSKGRGLRKPDVPGPRSQLSASEVGRVPGPQRAGPLLFVLLLSPQIRGTSCPGKSSFCFCGQGAESSAGLRDPRRGAVPCCGACRDWGAAGAGASAIPSHGPASQDRLPVPAAQGVSRHFLWSSRCPWSQQQPFGPKWWAQKSGKPHAPLCDVACTP